MRIAIDGSGIVCDATGGIETYFRSLVEEYARQRDLEFVVFAGPELRERLPRAPSLRFVDVPRASSRAAMIGICQGWLPWRARRERVDLLHFVRNVAATGRGFKSVLTLHDLIPHYYLRAFPTVRPLHNAARTAVMIASARAADHVITVSHAAARHIRAVTGVAAARISVVPNAPRPTGAGADETLPRGLEPGYFLAIGHGAPHKNLARLVRAYRSTDIGRPLVLAGIPGWAGYRSGAELRRLVDESNGRVVRLGFVPDATLATLYRHARALVFPSLTEGFGLPPLEAAACGVAVAASAIEPHFETLGSAALYFDPRDDAAVAGALIRLDRDRALCRRLAAAGEARAATFSWRATARSTMAVYRAVVNGERLPVEVARADAAAPT